MANTRWEPKAGAIAQVTLITVANTWQQNDTVTLTMNSKTVVVTIGTLVTTNQVATTIKQAWENETLTDTSASFTPTDGGQQFAEFTESTATSAASVVSLTADVEGVPFTLDVIADGTAGDGTATVSEGTAATGPNHANNVLNWTEGSIPAAGDVVFIDSTAVSLLYGLTEVLATFTSLSVYANFTGDIGLPETNALGYREYRDQYWKIQSSLINIGRGDGGGSGRIKIDGAAVTAEITVYATGSGAESGIAPFLFIGTGTNTLEVLGGDVGVAIHGGEVATVATTTVSGGTVFFGDGLTLTTITNTGGEVSILDNSTTINVHGGITNIGEAAMVTTINIFAGLVNYNSSGTLGTLNIGGQGDAATIDFSGDSSGRTLTNTTIDANAEIIDPANTVTYSNKIGVGSSTARLTTQ